MRQRPRVFDIQKLVALVRGRQPRDDDDAELSVSESATSAWKGETLPNIGSVPSRRSWFTETRAGAVFKSGASDGEDPVLEGQESHQRLYRHVAGRGFQRSVTKSILWRRGCQRHRKEGRPGFAHREADFKIKLGKVCDGVNKNPIVPESSRITLT